MECFTIKNVLLYFSGDSVPHISPYLSGKGSKPPGSWAMRDQGTEDFSGEIFFYAHAHSLSQMSKAVWMCYQTTLSL